MRRSFRFIAPAVIAASTLALTGCGPSAPDVEPIDGTPKAVQALSTVLPESETGADISQFQGSLQLGAIPDAPAGASVVVGCPYAQPEVVEQTLRQVSDGARLKPEWLPVDSDAYSTWIWVAPNGQVEQVWRVDMPRVNACTIGEPAVTLNSSDELTVLYGVNYQSWTLTPPMQGF